MFPEIYTLVDCPEGAVCITERDHLLVSLWIAQVERIHQTLSNCRNVHIDVPAQLGPSLL